jgi:hypothetical protein
MVNEDRISVTTNIATPLTVNILGIGSLPLVTAHAAPPRIAMIANKLRNHIPTVKTLSIHIVLRESHSVDITLTV